VTTSSHSAPYSEAGTTNYGIAGANTGAQYSQSSSSNTGATGAAFLTSTYGVLVGYGTYSYSCGFLGLESCTGYFPLYQQALLFSPFQYDAGVHSTNVNSLSAIGATAPSGSTMWFEFDSQNLYDATSIQYASFGSYNTSNGQLLNCNGADTQNCQIHSDVLINNMPSTTVPEPISMSLMATGLAGVALMRRRKTRQGS
jgi:hypothetical protein